MTAACQTILENLLGAEVGDPIAKRAVKDMDAAIRKEADTRGISPDMAAPIVADRVAQAELHGELNKARQVLMDARVVLAARRHWMGRGDMGIALREILGGTTNRPGKEAAYGADSIIKNARKKYEGLFIETLTLLGGENALHDFRVGRYNRANLAAELDRLDTSRTIPPTGDRQAEAIAKSIHDSFEVMRADMNLNGAHIRALKGYLFTTIHSPTKLTGFHLKRPDLVELVRLGLIDVDQADYSAWRLFIDDKVDHGATLTSRASSLIEKHGLAKAVRMLAGDENGEEFFRAFHRNIKNGYFGPSFDKLADNDAVVVSGKPTAEKVSQHRLLHWKDAESMIAYNEALGGGTLHDTVFAQIGRNARNIGLMQKLGTKPKQNWERIVAEATAYAAGDKGSTAKLKSIESANLGSVENVIFGAAEHVHNPRIASFHENFRTLTRMAAMSLSAITSITDRAAMTATARIYGMSRIQSTMFQLSELLPKDAALRSRLRSNFVGFDSMIGRITSAHADGMSQVRTKAENIYYRYLTGLGPMTDHHRFVSSMQISNHIAESLSKAFGDIDPELRNSLQRFGLNDKHWGIMQRIGAEPTDRGYNMFWTDSLSRIDEAGIKTLLSELGYVDTPANRKRAQADFGSRVNGYFADYINTAVPEPQVAERAMLAGNAKRGTHMGETWLDLMMFKGFPTRLTSAIIGREIFKHGESSLMANIKKAPGPILNRGAWLATQATVLGYASWCIKDMLSGKTPPQWQNEDGSLNMDIFFQSALRGGGIGILGDILLADYDQRTRGVLASMAGPVVGQIEIVGAGLTKLRRGESPIMEARRLVESNTPLITMPYTKLILNKLFMHNFEEWASPGVHERRAKQMQERFGQEYLDPFFDPTK